MPAAEREGNGGLRLGLLGVGQGISVLALIQAGAGCAGAREDAGSLDEGSGHCWWGWLWARKQARRNQEKFHGLSSR